MTRVYLALPKTDAEWVDATLDGGSDPKNGCYIYTGSDYNGEQVWYVETTHDNFTKEGGFSSQYTDMFSEDDIKGMLKLPAYLDSANVYRQCINPGSHHYTFSVETDEIEAVYQALNGNITDIDGNPLTAGSLDELKAQLTQSEDGKYIVTVKFNNLGNENESDPERKRLADFTTAFIDRNPNPDIKTLIDLSAGHPYVDTSTSITNITDSGDLSGDQSGDMVVGNEDKTLDPYKPMEDPLDAYPATWSEVFTEAYGAVQEIPARVILPYSTRAQLKTTLNTVALEGEDNDVYGFFMNGFNDDGTISLSELQGFKDWINGIDNRSFAKYFKVSYYAENVIYWAGFIERPVDLYTADQRAIVTDELDKLIAHIQGVQSQGLQRTKFEYPFAEGPGSYSVTAFFDKSKDYDFNDLEITDGSGKSTVLSKELAWTVVQDELGLSGENSEFVLSDELKNIVARYERHKDLRGF